MTMIDPEAEDEDVDARLEALVSELGADVTKATDFIRKVFGPERARAEAYYAGKSDLPVDGNRSNYVATKVRDTIRGVRPSLLRMFLGTAAVVEYLPSSAGDVAFMRQQTKFVIQQFEQAGGFRVIADAFQNAMLHKVGPVQWWWEKTVTTEYRTFENLTAGQLEMLPTAEGVRVMSQEQTGVKTSIGPNGEPVEEPLFAVEMAYDQTHGKTAMMSVLLTEFIIDEEAMNGRPPKVIGRRRFPPAGSALY